MGFAVGFFLGAWVGLLLLALCIAAKEGDRMADKPRLGALYRGYVPHLTDEEVRSAFKARYGQEPAEIHRTPACVLAGPLPKEGTDE